MLEILERIVAGKWNSRVIWIYWKNWQRLITEAQHFADLERVQPKPVISTIHAVQRGISEEHVLMRRHCRAGVTVRNLRTYKIDPEQCKGCSKCARNCPVGCDQQARSRHHFVIDTEKCIKCGTCKDNCAFGAIIYGDRRGYYGIS